MATGTIDIYSFFGGFEKVMLSGVDAGGAVVKGANIPEMLFVLHSMQVGRPLFLAVCYSGSIYLQARFAQT